jgi:hypothetical protein
LGGGEKERKKQKRKKEYEKIKSQVWWFTPVIFALRRQRQKDHEFEASLRYTANKKATHFL